LRTMVSHMIRLPKHAILAVLTIAFTFSTPLPPDASAVTSALAQGVRRGTGLPLPRYVSLKSDNVNVRRGPGQDYDLVFTFVRAGLPVEITQEFDNWRKIRDSEGDEGWVFHSLLSGERTALVAPWEIEGHFAAHSGADQGAAVVAYLAPKVIANVEECTGDWCLVSGEGFEGWIEQERLWGVYPDEQFED
jgi:SH3-like domain-containing protein